jgi:hypothetical protein
MVECVRGTYVYGLGSFVPACMTARDDEVFALDVEFLLCLFVPVDGEGGSDNGLLVLHFRVAWRDRPVVLTILVLPVLALD